jgi:hypothetical protein
MGQSSLFTHTQDDFPHNVLYDNASFMTICARINYGKLSCGTPADSYARRKPSGPNHRCGESPTLMLCMIAASTCCLPSPTEYNMDIDSLAMPIGVFQSSLFEE